MYKGKNAHGTSLLIPTARGILLLSSILCFLTISPGADLQRIICEGEPVPGHPEIEIDWAGPAAIGPNGHVISQALFTPPGSSSSSSMLLFSSAPGEPVQKLFETGDIISESLGPASSSSHYILDDQGNALIAMRFQTEPFVSTFGYVHGTPGALSVVVTEGQKVPELGYGMEIRSLLKMHMNHAGEIAYLCDTRNPSTNQRVMAVWKGPPGSQRIALRTGRHYPGLPEESVLHTIEDMWLNNDGVLAIDGAIEVRGRAVSGLWLYEGGFLTKIFLGGEPAIAANMEAGGLWLGGTIRSFADNNIIAFSGFTDRSGRGLFLAEKNNIRRVIQYDSAEGGIAPGTGGAKFDISFTPNFDTSTFVANKEGRAFLETPLEVGTGSPPVTATDRFGVWIWENGELNLVLRTGSAFPDSSNEGVLQTIGGAIFAPDGRLLLDTTYSGAIRKLIWAEDTEGSLAVIAQSNTSSLNMAEGSDKTVDNLSLRTRNISNGSDGRTAMVSAEGHVLLSVQEATEPSRDCVATREIGVLPETGTITGEARFDSDLDGDPLDPDPPLAGVSIELFFAVDGEPVGDAVATDTTDSEGAFLFENIPAGDYLLKANNPEGYQSTADSDGGSPDEIAVNLSPGAVSAGNTFLDALDAGTPVPSVLFVHMHRLNADGVTNLEDGLADIDSALVPTPVQEVLAAQPRVDRGLAADGVTPLLFRIVFDPQSLTVDRDISLQLENLGGGSTLLGLSEELLVLDGESWRSYSDSITLSAENPELFAAVNALSPDELSFSDHRAEIRGRLVVTDELAGHAIAVKEFAIRKLPVTLVHGYNTSGDWGPNFFTELAKSRAYNETTDEFIIVIRYGQNFVDGLLPSNVNRANTAYSLRRLAGELEIELENRLRPLRDNWAFTRHDIVAHSQGGLLTRMLMSENPPDPVQEGFQSAKNLFRGRFHRAVTIGSPHNGSRLVRYIMRLAETFSFDALASLQPGDYSYSHLAGALGSVGIGTGVVEAGILRSKFDPGGSEIRQLNNPAEDAFWKPDPDARIHLVRTTSNQGMPPSEDSAVVAHWVLGMANSGGSIVLPRGADGVVDWDSMGAHGPNEPVPDNVFTTTSSEEISHSGPVWIFSRNSFSPDIVEQTTSLTVARHVREALDQSLSADPSEIAFGPFTVPDLLTQNELAEINGAADSFTLVDVDNLSSDTGIFPFSAQTLSFREYSVRLSLSEAYPVVGDIRWYVEVAGPESADSGGVAWQPDPDDPRLLRVQIGASVVGDVVAYASYLSSNGPLVFSQPLLLESRRPADDPIVGYEVYPRDVDIEVGQRFSPSVRAIHDSGAVLDRFIGPAVSIESSNPDVIDVSDPRSWKANSTGSAIITVTIDGTPVETELNVVAPSLRLSFEEWKALHLTPSQLADHSQSSPASDADGDGETLFAEYLSGGDPNFPANIPIVSIEPGSQPPLVTLRLPTYQVAVTENALETTSDLAMWSRLYDVADDPNLQAPAIEAIENTGSHILLKFRIDHNELQNSQFFRTVYTE